MAVQERQVKSRYDLDALSVALPVPAVLAHFGHALRGRRGPCPLCGTSTRSSAFIAREDGQVWQCFACGAKGTPIALFAKLAGTSKAAAIEAMAAITGLSTGSPEDIEAAAATRRAAGAAAEAAKRAERATFQRIARQRDGARLIVGGYVERDPTLAGALYDLITRCEAALDTLATGDAPERAAVVVVWA